MIINVFCPKILFVSAFVKEVTTRGTGGFVFKVPVGGGVQHYGFTNTSNYP